MPGREQTKQRRDVLASLKRSSSLAIPKQLRSYTGCLVRNGPKSSIESSIESSISKQSPVSSNAWGDGYIYPMPVASTSVWKF
jgi:hypothetical protein